MDVHVSYPGIYLEALPSSIRVVTGATTAATAFVDYFARGPVEVVDGADGAPPTYLPVARRVASWAAFESAYGGLDHASEASYGLMQFFVNGGQTAWVVRVPGLGAAAATCRAALAIQKPLPHRDGSPSTTVVGRELDLAWTVGPEDPGPVGSYQVQLSLDGGASFQPVSPVLKASQMAFSFVPQTAAAKAIVRVVARDVDGSRLAADQLALTILSNTGPPAPVIAAVAPTPQVPAALLPFSAIDPGAWGNDLQVTISPVDQAKVPRAASLNLPFDLLVQEVSNQRVIRSESYRNLDWDPASRRFAPAVVGQGSRLVRCAVPPGSADPALRPPPLPRPYTGYLSGGADGAVPPLADLVAVLADGGPLDRIAPATFNLLCLPAAAKPDVAAEEMAGAVTAALRYCTPRQAFMIVDIPAAVETVSEMQDWAQPYLSATSYAGAVYFPRLLVADPLAGYLQRNVAASGTVAGVFARTDASQGVWKAPAGIEAGLAGANVALRLTDTENGQLNPLGINVLRSFPVFGDVVWGARTLAGAEQIESQWKYVRVRRLVDYIEISLVRGLKWAVFEPNDAALWANLQVAAGNFLANLYSQGAFAGASAAQAYFVRCDATTTTPADVARGIANVVIGVAPIDPAEFVIIQLQQVAGESQ